MSKIKCNSVNYRKGYIEVESGIHPGCVNLEVTGIHPDIDITNIDLGEGKLSDNSFISNTELELSADEAQKLVELLQDAISRLGSKRHAKHRE